MLSCLSVGFVHNLHHSRRYSALHHHSGNWSVKWSRHLPWSYLLNPQKMGREGNPSFSVVSSSSERRRGVSMDNATLPPSRLHAHSCNSQWCFSSTQQLSSLLASSLRKQQWHWEPWLSTLSQGGLALSSRIGGILFSSLIDYSPSVGASTAIFGLIGAIVSGVWVSSPTSSWTGKHSILWEEWWNAVSAASSSSCSSTCFSSLSW